MVGQRHAPAAFAPGKNRWGGPQRWSGQERKMFPQPGFDPRTSQPVASSYTMYAIPAHFWPRIQIENKNL